MQNLRLHYGLAEIAWRRKDFKTALRNYDVYLSNAPTNTPEAKMVMARAQQIELDAINNLIPPTPNSSGFSFPWQ